MNTEYVVLNPSDVRKQFPNALMAESNRQLVDQAEKSSCKIVVHYFDAIWGRTVVLIEVAKQ